MFGAWGVSVSPWLVLSIVATARAWWALGVCETRVGNRQQTAESIPELVFKERLEKVLLARFNGSTLWRGGWSEELEA